MKNTYNQRGALHLAAVAAVLVVGAIAAIGVKVLNQSQAATLRSSLITITVPAANATVGGYQEVFAKVGGERNIQKVVFFANDIQITTASFGNCFPSSEPQPALAPRSFLTCWDSSKTQGPVKLTAKVTFGNGDTARSLPVTVNVVTVPPRPTISASLTSPEDGAQVSGAFLVKATTSGPVTKVVFTANGQVIPNSSNPSCGAVVASPVPGTYSVCFNSDAAPFNTQSKLEISVNASDAAGNTAISTAVVFHPIIVTVPPMPQVQP